MPLCTKIGKKDSKTEEKRLRRKMQAGHENLNAVNLAGEYFCPKRRKYQEQWEVEKINGCKSWLSGAEIFVGKHGNVQRQGSAAMTSGLSLQGLFTWECLSWDFGAWTDDHARRVVELVIYFRAAGNHLSKLIEGEVRIEPLDNHSHVLHLPDGTYDA